VTCDYVRGFRHVSADERAAPHGAHDRPQRTKRHAAIVNGCQTLTCERIEGLDGPQLDQAWRWLAKRGIEEHHRAD
jgi:hypothetical protein